MNDLLPALLLGIIEGITEFLPISSTGHLLIAEHWLGARSDLFNIAIQAGAILAVVAIYWQRLWSLLLGFAQKSNRDYALKLILAFGITGALGLVVKKLGFQLPETLAPIAWALLVGGFVILAVEAIDARRADLPDDDPNAIGWGTAMLVGLAQVLAGVFPGTSRSAAAIFSALLFGRSSRVAATEFAFLVGIPTMFAATGYELLHTLKDGGAAGEDWTALGIAFVVSAVVAFIAVKWLLRYIQTHRFTLFAWYRIALGAALLMWVYSSAAAAPASNATARKQTGGPVTAALAHSSSGGFIAVGTSAVDSIAVVPPTDEPALSSAPVGPARPDPAIATFRLAKLCVQAAMNAPLVDQADAAGYVAPKDSPYFTDADRQRQIEEANRLLDVLEQAKTDCHAPTDTLLDGSVYELALRAAQAGDERAASCFVGGAFPIPPALWERADVQERFMAQAAPLLARGIRQGDWSMVVLASLAVNPKRYSMRHEPILPIGAPGMVMVMNAFKQGDTQQAYALALLREIGAADRVKGTNAGFIAATARQLTPAQRAHAQAWAQDAFVRYFHGRKWDRADLEPCPV